MGELNLSQRLFKISITAILSLALLTVIKGFGDDDPYEVEVGEEFIFSTSNMTGDTKYLIYDVNPGEGFNLRLDVYIRVANLINHLNNRGEHWILVLPPWRHLYHWQSQYVKQEALQWKQFFDVRNMNNYVPVMEFEDFMKFEGYHGIDHILFLQRHPNGHKERHRELIEIDRCIDRFHYHLDEDHRFRGYFWNIEDVYAKKHDCVSVQGRATILTDFLKHLNLRSVFIERFEQLLHIQYGNVEYYKARRSLVFARELRAEGNAFRLKYLNSNDEDDDTHYEEDWRVQIPLDGHARGGPFIGVHMRRGDFAYAHRDILPSTKEIGEKIAVILKKYRISKVYVATDGTDKEIGELQSYSKAKIYRFPRTREILDKFKDGGIAIIDQWIVSHARYFIGTCKSTFSSRIHEERDILGFKPDTTYNCICGNQSPAGKCEQPPHVRVKFTRTM